MCRLGILYRTSKYNVIVTVLLHDVFFLMCINNFSNRNFTTIKEQRERFFVAIL